LNAVLLSLPANSSTGCPGNHRAGWFFAVFEVLDPLMLLFISAGWLAGFGATTLVQRFLAKDDWGPALAKGFVMVSLRGAVSGGWDGHRRTLLIWPGFTNGSNFN